MYKHLTNLRRRLFVTIGVLSFIAASMQANAQCNNGTAYSSATVGANPGNSGTIFCHYAGEYGPWSGIQPGFLYTVTSSNPADFITVRFSTPGGTVVASGTQPLQFYAAAAGTYYIHINTNSGCGTQNSCRDVTTTNNGSAAPAAPPAPTQAAGIPTCTGGTALSVTGTPPANVTWYWQTSATGTSNANNAATPWTVFANGTYYVRAFDAVYNLWSATSSSVTVSNFPSAATPPAATAGANPACISTTLTASAAPGGMTYYWQTVPDGSSMANNAATPLTVNATGTYYLAAYDNTSQCWSPTVATPVTINTNIPPAAVVNSPIYNYCSSEVTMPISAQTPPATPGNCTFTASASGTDMSNVTATINNFNCGVTANTSASLNASIGAQCTAWYYYSIIVNGVTVATQQCNQTNFNLTPYLPLTSVSIVSYDNPADGIGDFVNMSLTVNVSSPAPVYGLTWFDAPTGGSNLGNTTTIEALGTSVIPTATNGNYSFYVANNFNGCESSTRELVTVNIVDVNAEINPVHVTCNGGDNGSFTLGTIECGTGNFEYSIDGGLTYGPIPTDLIAGDYMVMIHDITSDLYSAGIPITINEPAAPSALNATNVTYYNATLGWTTTGDETSWTIIYGEAGFDPETEGTIIPNATNPYTLTGVLTESTAYEFYVFSECGPVADTSGPQPFTTDSGFLAWDSECGPGFIDITSTGTPAGFTPFTPNYFDDQSITVALPWPWVINNQTVNNIVLSVNGAVLFNAGFPGYTPGGPGLYPFNQDLESNDPVAVYYESIGTAPNRQFIIQWVAIEDYSGTFTPPGNSGTFEVIVEESTGEVYYIYDDVDFGNPGMDNGAQAAIALYTSNGNQTVSTSSSTYLSTHSCIHFYNALCPNITNFSSIVYPDEVILDWNPGLYNEVDWTVVIGLEGFDPSNAGEIIATYNETASASDITNLQQNTTYDVYIYSECMADNLTSDGYLYTFTTLPFCSNPSTFAGTTDVDSLELTWNWTEYLGGTQTYDVSEFHIMYEMDGVYMNEVDANGINFADTVVDANLIGSGVYQVYVQAECSTGDTSAWVGPITVVMPLSNDTVCGAEMLEMDYVYTLNNVGATVSVDEINVAPPATGAQETDGWATSTLNNTVWYRFTAPPSGSVRINNTAISYNGQLAVYDVADCGDFNSNFNLVAANDNEIDGASLAPNFTVCGLIPGNVYYVLHDGTGTTGNYSISISEIVLQAGSAEPVTQICYGEILDLNTTISGNDAGGAWSAPVAAVNASINGSMLNSNGLAYQTFDFQYRMTDGCAYDSIISQVQIFAPSNAGTDGSVTICKNEPVNLFGGLSGTVDLNGQWYDPSDVMSSADIVGSAFPGSFNYDYIAGNGVCPDDTSNVLVVVLSSCDYLSLEEATFAGVQLYPNPTSGIINIDADKAFNVEVTDANGRMIKKGISTTVGTTSIDLGKVQVGVYFVTLRANESSKVYRVVVQ